MGKITDNVREYYSDYTLQSGGLDAGIATVSAYVLPWSLLPTALLIFSLLQVAGVLVHIYDLDEVDEKMKEKAVKGDI